MTHYRNTFPPELIDSIIEFLHDDVPTLRSCHLVCRSWTPASKYHLFSHLNLTPSARAYSNLYSILSSEKLPSLVDDLTLSNSMESLFHLSDFFDIFIPLLGLKLSHLHSLTLVYLDFSRLSVSSQKTIKIGFTTLRKLSLNSVTFRHFRDFTHLILAHPEVRELSLTRIRWMDDDLKHPREDLLPWRPPRNKLNVSKIALVDLPMRIVEWFIDYTPNLRIESLIWNSTTCGPEVSALSRFLQSACYSLEHLSVSFHSEESRNIASSDRARHELLANNRDLRSLTFNRLFFINDANGSLFWLPHFLREVRSSALEEITFDIIWAHLDQLAHFDWSYIEDILCTPRFQSLKRIRFRSGSRKEEKGRNAVTLEYFIRTKWTRLAKQGILMFE